MPLSAGAPVFSGGNRARLLQGGDELFPAMVQAIAQARAQVWLATYLFNDDSAGQQIGDALVAAAARGVLVQLVVDGFGSLPALPQLRARLSRPNLGLHVFRPLDRWTAWLQPEQLRRLHHKLCVVDAEVAFVGGINIIDDRFDRSHGHTDLPRLDFAVELRGPAVLQVQQVARALALRARLGREWRAELRGLAQRSRRLGRAQALLRRLQVQRAHEVRAADATAPVQVAIVVRDNLRRRHAIEHAYIDAICSAQRRIDLACPYFYPGQAFRRALVAAATRGVQVRLLLQGKVDYRIAAIAARALYDALLAAGVRIYEYTPAFLHAKVAVVDDDWSTLGSSNIDPLSLLLNLEANAIVRDAAFAQELAARFDRACAVSFEVKAPPQRAGWRRWLSRGLVAWCATVFLRVAGITGRY